MRTPEKPLARSRVFGTMKYSLISSSYQLLHILKKRNKMSSMIQFNFFEEKPSEIDLLKIDIKNAVDILHKVRRGTYASINELKKENFDLKSRLEILERNICNGKKEAN